MTFYLKDYFSYDTFNGIEKLELWIDDKKVKEERVKDYDKEYNRISIEYPIEYEDLEFKNVYIKAVSNHGSDIKLVKANFENYLYLFESRDRYIKDKMFNKKNLIGEMIFDRDGNLIHEFKFSVRKVIYLSEYKLLRDYDFVFKYLIKDIIKDNLSNYKNNENLIYYPNFYKTNNSLLLPIYRKYNKWIGSDILVKINRPLKNRYLEFRISATKLLDIDLIFSLKDMELFRYNSKRIKVDKKEFELDLTRYQLVGFNFLDDKIEIYINHELVGNVFKDIGNYNYEFLNIKHSNEKKIDIDLSKLENYKEELNIISDLNDEKFEEIYKIYNIYEELLSFKINWIRLFEKRDDTLVFV